MNQSEYVQTERSAARGAAAHAARKTHQARAHKKLAFLDTWSASSYSTPTLPAVGYISSKMRLQRSPTCRHFGARCPAAPAPRAKHAAAHVTSQAAESGQKHAHTYYARILGDARVHGNPTTAAVVACAATAASSTPSVLAELPAPRPQPIVMLAANYIVQPHHTDTLPFPERSPTHLIVAIAAHWRPYFSRTREQRGSIGMSGAI